MPYEQKNEAHVNINVVEKKNKVLFLSEIIKNKTLQLLFLTEKEKIVGFLADTTYCQMGYFNDSFKRPLAKIPIHCLPGGVMNGNQTPLTPCSGYITHSFPYFPKFPFGFAPAGKQTFNNLPLKVGGEKIVFLHKLIFRQFSFT